MDDYASKPVKPEELEAVLDRWFSQERQDLIDRDVIESLRSLQGDDEPDLVAEIGGILAPTRLREAVGEGRAHGACDQGRLGQHGRRKHGGDLPVARRGRLLRRPEQSRSTTRQA
ncbi:MAG TPA: hypothetical protein VJ827_11320 [Rubrobacter sp.]|nr:hypothetical protein [Rubrobacter sp.]